MAALTVTAANVIPVTGYTFDTGIAGASITAGQPLYIDASDSNKLKLADANASDATAAAVGIALHAAASGQPIRYITGGDLNPGATMTVGDVIVVGATAGEMNPVGDLTTGWRTTILGVASTATNLKMRLYASGVTHA